MQRGATRIAHRSPAVPGCIRTRRCSLEACAGTSPHIEHAAQFFTRHARSTARGPVQPARWHDLGLTATRSACCRRPPPCGCSRPSPPNGAASWLTSPIAESISRPIRPGAFAWRRYAEARVSSRSVPSCSRAVWAARDVTPAPHLPTQKPRSWWAPTGQRRIRGLQRVRVRAAASRRRDMGSGCPFRVGSGCSTLIAQ